MRSAPGFPTSQRALFGDRGAGPPDQVLRDEEDSLSAARRLKLGQPLFPRGVVVADWASECSGTGFAWARLTGRRAFGWMTGAAVGIAVSSLVLVPPALSRIVRMAKRRRANNDH